MSGQFGNFFAPKPPQKGGAPSPQPNRPSLRGEPQARRQVYSKIFRWQLPDGQTEEPSSVEVLGSFNRWQKIPLARNPAHDGWQVALHDIPGNRTHHYMLLVDGQPAYDPHNDGLAIPSKPEELRHQLMTEKGPRVFMLFAQTK